MSTETANIFIVVFAGLNIVVLILTLLVVWKYTKETEKMQQAVTTQSLAMIKQTELSNKMYAAAQSQIEQMSHQTYISLKMYESAQRQTEELIHQRRLSILPAFAARLKQDKSGPARQRLYLKNIGIGIAINIEIARLNFLSPTEEDFSTVTGFTPKHIHTNSVLNGRNGYSLFQPIQSLGKGEEQIIEHSNHFEEEEEGPLLQQYGHTAADFLSLIDENIPLHINFQDIEGNKYHQVITRKGDMFVPSPVKLAGELEEQSKAEQGKKAAAQNP